jgi:hypothetical protein
VIASWEAEPPAADWEVVLALAAEPDATALLSWAKARVGASAKQIALAPSARRWRLI